LLTVAVMVGMPAPYLRVNQLTVASQWSILGLFVVFFASGRPPYVSHAS
jgi:hypothetical protein